MGGVARSRVRRGWVRAWRASAASGELRDGAPQHARWLKTAGANRCSVPPLPEQPHARPDPTTVLASPNVRTDSCFVFSMICSCTDCDWLPITTVPDCESIFALRRTLRMRFAIHFSAVSCECGNRRGAEVHRGVDERS
jgi:hypothetical protein